MPSVREYASRAEGSASVSPKPSPSGQCEACFWRFAQLRETALKFALHRPDLRTYGSDDVAARAKPISFEKQEEQTE